MKVFGIGIMTLLVVLSVGYMVGVLYPSWGKKITG